MAIIRVSKGNADIGDTRIIVLSEQEVFSRMVIFDE